MDRARPALNVLYEDNHLLVVVKPPGLLAQADRTGDVDVLTLGKAYIKERYAKPGNVYLGLVHRLDRPASGVMVLARTSKAAARLSDQFRKKTPVKRYMAVVEGAPEGEGACAGYIAKVGRQPRLVSREHPGARLAELRWRVVRRDRERALVDVLLRTGRPHQIRLQLAGEGWPILGDLRHGARNEWDGRNLALHAYGLELEHPVRRVRMAWSATPPPGWPAEFAEAAERLLTEHGAGESGLHWQETNR